MFVAAGLIFVARAAIQSANDGAFHDVQLSWLALGFVLAMSSMTWVAARWHVALALVGGSEMSQRDAVANFFQGEIGKYLPGSLWAVVGRGELATRAGVRRSVAYASVALSLLGLYLAGGAVTAAFLPGRAGGGLWPVLLVVGFLIAGTVGLHPKVMGAVFAFARRFSKFDADEVPSWGASIRLVAGYVPAWLMVTLAFWCCVQALDADAAFASVAFASVLAWCAGFLFIPAPGGIGVRESIFALACGIAGPDAAAVALLARLLFVLADGAGAAVGALATTRRRSG